MTEGELLLKVAVRGGLFLLVCVCSPKLMRWGGWGLLLYLGSALLLLSTLSSRTWGWWI